MMEQQPIEVGLVPSQEELLWAIFEKTGSIAEAARECGTTYYAARCTFNRDPIRFSDTQKVRAEEVSHRWEQREKRCSRLLEQLLASAEKVMWHIEECEAGGEDMTNLVGFKGVKLSCLQARQWLMETKQIDAVQRAAFTAAKISEGMRRASGEFEAMLAGGTGPRDPSQMNDDELRKMVIDLEASGRQLPWGLEQWKKAQPGHALGTGS